MGAPSRGRLELHAATKNRSSLPAKFGPEAAVRHRLVGELIRRPLDGLCPKEGALGHVYGRPLLAAAWSVTRPPRKSDPPLRPNLAPRRRSAIAWSESRFAGAWTVYAQKRALWGAYIEGIDSPKRRRGGEGGFSRRSGRQREDAFSGSDACDRVRREVGLAIQDAGKRIRRPGPLKAVALPGRGRIAEVPWATDRTLI
jgi:hypothetical protein